MSKTESQKEAGAASAGSPCSAIGRMVERLAARGLVPSAHNLVIWEHVDGSGWGACVDTPYRGHNVEAHGATLRQALEELMLATNRGADISANAKVSDAPDSAATNRETKL